MPQDRLEHSGQHRTEFHSSIITSSTQESVSGSMHDSPNTTGVHSSESTATASEIASTDTTATTSGDTENARSAESESESPLDNANFLSFEEWRKKTLAKVGQSLENVGHARGENLDRQHSGINNALDTIGDESEIDLDFSWFGSQPDEASNDARSAQRVDLVPKESPSSPGSTTPRSKDAGKTCKERTNYASFDCAATVLKSNSECKSASSVLVEHKDSYMLNTCSAENKFFVVELCNDILVDTIVLANYEFFSSIFRHFRVSVSDRYPVKEDKWKELGTFEARNTRDIQAFLVENPLIWARYLRIEFLTHYGNEYYCPVSLLRVHGTTMMQDFKQEEELARGELPEDEEMSEVKSIPLLTLPVESAPVTHDDTHPNMIEDATDGKSTSATDVQPAKSSQTIALPAVSTLDYPFMNGGNIFASDAPESTCATTFEPSTSSYLIDTATTNSTDWRTASTVEDDPNLGNITSTTTIKSAITSTMTVTTTVAISSSQAAQMNTPSTTPSSGEPIILTNVTVVELKPTSSTTGVSSSTVSVSTSSPPYTSRTPESSSNNTFATSSTNSTKAVATPLQASAPPPPQPSTQESFFKSIHKRLQQLESNSTLSLQYIEEQSRILRDAFNKVEKRQLSDTNNFLSHLNDTVMTELHVFRQQYDQLWQSTVIELESQREKYQGEMRALSGRLTLVADELVWQKRMGIIQSTLLLLCIGLVLFAKQGNGYLEVPLMQQMISRSQAAMRAGLDSPPYSPSPESRSPVSLFRRKIWRSGTEPTGVDILTDASDSRPQTRDGLEYQVESATPDRQSDENNDVESDGFGEPLTETRSSPATPTGTRDKVNDPSTWQESLEMSGSSPLRVLS
ncbi:Hypothetical protein R9X50_00490500 [Acrodontium crateriforme]|uniref:SUN domain-containing protein n=1 Tax=Acrodontium crateriforme TaxID=150365 RepID=A0AAQ3M662_9PEZI|nr:Hypothetical protein R9X50_00490500 [Acrodontium crateriforme]